MNKLHIKKGDAVTVITGKDKGKTGVVVKAFPKINRVVVEGINMVKKHQRPKKAGEKGQIIQKAVSIHASNVRRSDSTKKLERKSKKTKTKNKK